ncbi:MAG: glycine cleavage system protein GcvH [Magnetococcales bacterium]|nr:glycine cleavage system protein GcvH [Magnetococcales bacterium]
MSEIGAIPEDLRYSREHEWVRVQAGEVEVGITAYAANALGDVVFVELPGNGTRLTMGKPFGVVESVKSVSDLFSPVTGVVSGVNAVLEESPELVNEAPYGRGWMIRITPDHPEEVHQLLSAAEYQAMLSGASQ